MTSSDTGTPETTTPDHDVRGCETELVTELPPPEMPPPGAPGGASASPPSGTPAASSSAPKPNRPGDKSSFLDEFRDPDWDRVRALAEDWFRPLTKPEGWKALGYLFVGMLSSIGFFVATLAG